MSADDELYPGLDDELDAAFRRNVGEDLDVGTPTTLEEVVQKEIAQETPESIADTYEKRFVELEQEVGRVIDIDDLKEVLGEFNELVKDWLAARAENDKAHISNNSLAARDSVLEAAESAIQKIIGTDVEEIYTRAQTLRTQGQPSTAQSFIRSKADPRDIPIIEAALNNIVLEQAVSQQLDGKPSAARSHIDAYASDIQTAQQIKQALDEHVMNAVEQLQINGMIAGARSSIDTFASSPEVAAAMKDALDVHVIADAEKQQAENRPSGARGIIDGFASSPIIARRMKQALDYLVLLDAEQTKNQNRPSSATTSVSKYSSSPEVEAKILEVLGL